MIYEVIAELTKPPGYEGDLIEADGGTFALVWVRARSEFEAKAIVKTFVDSDGATIRQFESVTELQEDAAENADHPESEWEFGDLVKVIGLYDYEYDDEEVGFDILDSRAEA